MFFIIIHLKSSHFFLYNVNVSKWNKNSLFLSSKMVKMTNSASSGDLSGLYTRPSRNSLKEHILQEIQLLVIQHFFVRSGSKY